MLHFQFCKIGQIIGLEDGSSVLNNIEIDVEVLKLHLKVCGILINRKELITEYGGMCIN